MSVAFRSAARHVLMHVEPQARISRNAVTKSIWWRSARNLGTAGQATGRCAARLGNPSDVVHVYECYVC